MKYFKYIFFILLFLFTLIYLFLFLNKSENYNYGINENRDLINILDSKENIIGEIKLSDFKEKINANLSSFPEKPKVATRDFDLDFIKSFDNNIYLNNGFLFFSISDYASLTTTSIIGFYNIKNKKINFINKVFSGDLSNFLSFDNNSKILFIHNTARSMGDFLSVYDLNKNTLIETIGEDKIKYKLGLKKENIFIPNIRNIKEKNNIIYFETDGIEFENKLYREFDINSENLKFNVKPSF